MKLALGTFINKVSSFLAAPLKIAGLLFFSKAKNQPRDNWDTAGFQLNNEVETLPPNTWHQGLEFTALNNDYISFPDTPLSDFTIGVVIYYNAVNSSLPLGNFSANDDWFIVAPNGDIQVRTGFVISEWSLVLDSVTDVGWHYLQVRRSGATLSLWIDGVKQTDITGANATDFNANAIAARNNGNYQNQQQGLTYAIGSALSDIQIEALYTDTNGKGVSGIQAINAYNPEILFPLADYDVADGARSAGDPILEYSGNGNDGTIQGTSVTPVYTPPVGYQVREDKYNVVSDQYIFDTGNGTDIQGNAIPAFTGAAAPNAKAFTGGAIEFTAANSDYISLTQQTLSGDFTIMCYVKGWTVGQLLGTTVGLNDLVQLGYSGNLDAVRVFINSSDVEWDGVLTNNDYYHVTITRTNDVLRLYIDGVVNGTTYTLAGDLTFENIGRASNVYANTDFTDIAIFNSALSADRILEYYNNPNKFVEYVRADSAIIAFDCNQGTYAAGSPVIDVSGNGNHGIVQGASSEMALNNVEVGSQTATHGFTFYQNLGVIGTASSVIQGSTTTIYPDSVNFSNVSINDLVVFEGSSRISKVIDIDFGDLIVSGNAGNFSFQNIIHYKLGQGTDNFIVPAISDKGTTDIFGNTVEAPWVEGLLNFTGFDPSRIDTGELNNSLYFDETSYTAFTVLKFNSSSGFPQLWSNMRFGTNFGQRLIIAGDGSSKFNLSNGSDVPALLSLDSNADATIDKWHFVAVTLSLNGDATIYYGDLDTPMAFDKSGNVGLRASSNTTSRLLAFGKALGSSSASFPTVNGTLQNVFFTGELSLNEIEKLRKYFIKKIPQ